MERDELRDAPESTTYVGPFALLEEALAEEIRRAQADDPLRAVRVVVGSGFTQSHLTLSLARRMGAYANVRVTTIHGLARDLALPGLAAAGRRAAPALARERLVARLVRRRGRRWYFAPVAALPGLSAALLRTLDDLREACVPPADVSAHAGERGAGKKLVDLAALYTEYVAELETAGLFDDAALYEAATTRLTGEPRSAGGAVLVYGLYDVAEMQRRLLAALARSTVAVFTPFAGDAGDMTAALAGEDSDVRQLVPSGTGTLARVVAGFDGRREGTAQEDGRQVPPADASLAVISVPDETAKRSAVVREAVAAAQAGVPSWDVAVVAARRATRDDLAAALVTAGLPVAAQKRGGDEGALLCRLLLDCITPPRGAPLARSAVLDFLATAPLRDGRPSPAVVARWDRLTRRARVVAGEAEWRDRLGNECRRLEWRLARAGEDGGSAEAAELGHDVAALEALQGCVRRLIAAAHAVPTIGSWHAITGAFLAALARLCLPVAEADGGGLAAVRALAGLDVVDDSVTREQFATVARRVLDEVVGTSGSVGRAGVAVLSPHQVRGLSFHTVVVGDLAEGGFPGSPPPDTVLLDTERDALSAKHGVRLETAADREREARALFILSLQAARRRVVLIHPRLDAATGSPRLPSRLLLAAAEAHAGRPVAFAEVDQPGALGGLVVRVPTTAVPPLRDAGATAAAGAIALEEAQDEREFDLAVLLSAPTGRCDREISRYVDGVMGATGRRRREALAARRVPRLTAFDGRVASQRAVPAAAALFAQPVSASALETYLDCPFRFYVRYLLGIVVDEEPALAVDIDPADLGTLVHGVLRDLYAEVADDSRLGVEDALARLPGILDRACMRAEADGLAGYPLAWRVRRAQLAADLERAVRDDKCWRDDRRPALLEWEFGGPGEPAVTLAGGPPGVRFAGRVDRLDRGPEGLTVRLVDYKTGKGETEAEQLKKGRNVQLPVYRLAAATLDPAPTSIECEFRMVTRRGGFATLPLTDEEGRVDAGLARALRVVVDGVAAGIFPRWRADDRRCTHCPLESGCDARVWSHELKLRDARLAPLLAFRERGDESSA